jgi:hypothetical protein
MISIETMSLSDLLIIQSILEKRVMKMDMWVEDKRGTNYEEYSKRLEIFEKDENKIKLDIVNSRIEDYIRAIK